MDGSIDKYQFISHCEVAVEVGAKILSSVYGSIVVTSLLPCIHLGKCAVLDGFRCTL